MNLAEADTALDITTGGPLQGSILTVEVGLKKKKEGE